LAIKPNTISLLDYKSKELVKTQRMSDLKSWFSGDGYYNLTPIFLLNPSASMMSQAEAAGGEFSPSQTGAMDPSIEDQSQPGTGATVAITNGSSSASSTLAKLFRLNANSIDMNKLFVIEFRNSKWHLQIDDFHSLKSITCILLDQSLDMGIDSNPLMLDLTISEHFQNRYKIFASNSPPMHATAGRQSSALSQHSASFAMQQHKSAFSKSKSHQHHHSSSSKTNLAAAVASGGDKKSATSNTNSANKTNDASPSVSIVVQNNQQRNQSMLAAAIGIDSDSVNYEQTNQACNMSSMVPAAGSFSLLAGGSDESASTGAARGHRSGIRAPMASIFSLGGVAYGSNKQLNAAGAYSGGGGGFFSSTVYKYEMEFQELQYILLWFPEEVALRLTEVEYQLFRSVPPSEYLRHVTLDMNNFKGAETTTVATSATLGFNNKKPIFDTLTTYSAFSASSSAATQAPTRSVQDLIVRYKEVRLFELVFEFFFFSILQYFIGNPNIFALLVLRRVDVRRFK
jgi:hypothetical protein